MTCVRRPWRSTRVNKEEKKEEKENFQCEEATRATTLPVELVIRGAMIITARLRYLLSQN